MEIKTKYNIGDKVAINRDGEMSVMTIDGISIDRIADHPTEIRYSGVETIDRQLDIREEEISGTCALSGASERKGLPNGIYILDKECGCVSLACAKEYNAEDDNAALGVVLITDHARIFIAKNEPEDMRWNDAMKFCASEPSYNDEPLRLPDTHEGQEIAFNRTEINKAMELIGGKPIGTSWYWTNREYNSNFAFFFSGSGGYVGNYSKYYAHTVRPVSVFKR